MRIAVLYNRDIYALKALHLLLPELAEHTVTLFHTTRVGNPTGVPPPLLALASAEQTLLEALTTPVDVPALVDFATLAARFGCGDQSLSHINSPEGVAELAAFRPDVILSIRFGRILQPAAIATAPSGVLNLHSGLLPAYRGVMPTFWSMLHGAQDIGTSLHWVPDAGIDTGPVVARTRQALDPQRSYMAQVWALYDAGIAAMIDALVAVASGRLVKNTTSLEPIHDAAGYYSYPDAVALEAFARNGCQLVREGDHAAILLDAASIASH